jgi:hypothetical protein
MKSIVYRRDFTLSSEDWRLAPAAWAMSLSEVRETPFSANTPLCRIEQLVAGGKSIFFGAAGHEWRLSKQGSNNGIRRGILIHSPLYVYCKTQFFSPLCGRSVLPCLLSGITPCAHSTIHIP